MPIAHIHVLTFGGQTSALLWLCWSRLPAKQLNSPISPLALAGLPNPCRPICNLAYRNDRLEDIRGRWLALRTARLPPMLQLALPLPPILPLPQV